MIRHYYHKDGLAAVRRVVFPAVNEAGKPDTSTVHLAVAAS